MDWSPEDSPVPPQDCQGCGIKLAADNGITSLVPSSLWFLGVLRFPLAFGRRWDCN